MLDKIVEGYLRDFVQAADLANLESSTAFEFFINHLIVSRDHPEVFSLENISVGGGGDFGIDGLVVIVNDRVVDSTEDIDYWKRHLKRLDVRFIFIQSKTSPNFDGAEIGTFIYGVRTFFDDSISITNEKLQRARRLKNAIYDSTGDMNEAPRCDLYYAALGKWQEDEHLRKRIDSEVRLIKETGLFSETAFFPIDSVAIKARYQELRRKVAKEIVFEKHTSLPSISGVQQAYIGVIPAQEYLKLISDTDGRLQRSLFYDNVRDFLGNNPVNTDIRETLEKPDLHDNFTILNNGVTVVARALNQVGPKFKLTDFQIVNGCQTSHVLHGSQLNLSDVFVPIKLIITDDQEVTNRVIKATNWQTEVKEEAFESLSSFQKELEEFYRTVEVPVDRRLHYERRARQYEQDGIDPRSVISLTHQIKSFIAMFFNEPHSTHRYYGELLEANRQRIFLPDHSPFPYFLSGLALRAADEFISRAGLPRTHSKFRYQILMLFRLLSESESLPHLNSKKIVKYCEVMLDLLCKSIEAEKVFRRAVNILDEALKNENGVYEGDRTKAFTNRLIEVAKVGEKAKAAPDFRERGFVKNFSATKGFGFIHSDSRNTDIFVHYSSIRSMGYRFLKEGALVEFTAVNTAKGLSAVDVTCDHVAVDA